jgi:hypothetical protein
MTEDSQLFYMGIDPGRSGAWAMVDGLGRLAAVDDYPGDVRELARIVGGRLKLLPTPVCLAVMEQSHAIKGSAARNTFQFGENYGAWQGLLAASGTPCYIVTPRTWQKVVLDSETRTKPKGALEFARRRWPAADLHLVAHHHRADALCMAEYGRLTLGRR